MSNTFPWLRADVPDDVIIAGALELMWQDLTARVTAIATVRLKGRVRRCSRHGDASLSSFAGVAALRLVRPSDPTSRARVPSTHRA